MADAFVNSGSPDSLGRSGFRKGQCKLASLAEFAGSHQPSSVVFYDAARQRESQSGSVPFGGKKWPEDIRQHLWRNSLAGVDHGRGDEFFIGRELHANTAAFAAGLHRIQQ